MRIHISSRRIDDISRLCSGSATSRGGRRAGQTWSRPWDPLSMSDGWRCSCSFVFPVCQGTLGGAILASKAAGCLVLTKHRRVSSYHSVHPSALRKFNTPVLLFSDLGARFPNKIFRFPYCGAGEAFFGHFGQIQCKVHVRLFQSYPTSLPCLSCRNVANLQDINSCY